MSVIYKSGHVGISFQLLEMSSITIPNQTISNVCKRYIFQGVFRKNISNFSDLHNEKNKSGSFVLMELFQLLDFVQTFTKFRKCDSLRDLLMHIYNSKNTTTMLYYINFETIQIKISQLY